MRFWYFWLAHVVIVGGALYGVAARGYRPTWRDFRVATLTGIIYVALVLPFNLMTNLNYGYVGQSAPGQPSLVDSLGPWPGRVGVMLALGVAVMTLLMLPWQIVRRREGRLGSHVAAGQVAAGVPHPGQRPDAGWPRRS